MKIKARVGADHRQETVTELDYFTVETEKGEFAISFQNGKLRISEVSLFDLAVLPQTANCLDIVATATH